MTRPNVPGELVAAPAAIPAATGVAASPATAMKRMPPTSSAVSTFWAVARVVAQHEGEQGDGAGLYHAQPSPREQEPEPGAQRTRPVVVVATGAGVGRRQLGVAERAQQRDEAAGQPGEQRHAHAAGVL